VEEGVVSHQEAEVGKVHFLVVLAVVVLQVLITRKNIRKRISFGCGIKINLNFNFKDPI
jgi:hypothetical protein